MSAGQPAPPPAQAGLGGVVNEEADLRELGRLLAKGERQPGNHRSTVTSDLSLDEILLLHSVGLEPAGVVFGVGCVSIVVGAWTWAIGRVNDAVIAFDRAMEEAKSTMRRQVQAVDGAGVVGVDVEIEMAPHRAMVAITGTAVKAFPGADDRSHFRVRYPSAFLCDLSARDFVVLGGSGWYPLDLVAGASYVHAPRRTMGAAMGQMTQNVELTNYTETLYDAREAAMGSLQQAIRGSGGTGLVDMKIIDRPMEFARHVVEFVAYGTSVKMLTSEHSHPNVSVVLPVDDKARNFEATSLR
jgi:uncharacterized protein YbjQ (UPF0145 family)